MTDWPARAALETISDEIQLHLRANPGDAEGQLFHAKILFDLARFPESEDAYRRALDIAPTHVGALIGSAVVAQHGGRRGEALTLLERAVAFHPESAAAHANLAHLVAVDDPERGEKLYLRALSLDPSMCEAHAGLCTLYALNGDADRAKAHRALGYADAATRVLPYRGTQWPVPALLLVSTDGGNVYTDQLLDDRVYQVTKLFVEAFDNEQKLPLHKVVVNGIGDADLCRDALHRAVAIAARAHAPVVNDPAAVLQGGRIADALRMAEIPNVKAPRVETFDAASPPGFPFLLRVVGHHMGRYFERIKSVADMDAALATFPRGERIAMQLLDARGADRQYRKYRVMIVDGVLYPLHLAIGAHWKVHYFSADMLENQANRDEERAFLTDMARVLGERAMTALHAIAERLGLDYAGIDFALDGAGNVLLFEANATMTVIEPAADPQLEYRRAPTERIVEAMARLTRSRVSER